MAGRPGMRSRASRDADKRTMSRGRRRKDAYVSERERQLIEGEITVKDLTDKELEAQRIAFEDGSLPSGLPPKLPPGLTRQMSNEQVRRAKKLMQNYVRRGAERLMRIADTAEKDSDAINAIKFMMDHAIGKPVEHVVVKQEDPWETVINDVLDEEYDEQAEPERRPSRTAAKGRRTRSTKTKAD